MEDEQSYRQDFEELQRRPGEAEQLIDRLQDGAAAAAAQIRAADTCDADKDKVFDGLREALAKALEAASVAVLVSPSPATGHSPRGATSGGVSAAASGGCRPLYDGFKQQFSELQQRHKNFQDKHDATVRSLEVLRARSPGDGLNVELNCTTLSNTVGRS